MDSIGQAIELSLTPVFVLVAIASFLNVIATRLGRVVDRARDMEALVVADTNAHERRRHMAELRSLDRRMTYNHWAINFFSVAALIVTALVMAIFFISVTGAHPSGLVAALFGGAMACILAGICFFLAEIYAATQTVRVQADLLIDRSDTEATS